MIKRIQKDTEEAVVCMNEATIEVKKEKTSAAEQISKDKVFTHSY